MNIGVKHSLCLISMLSKMQPSESMPTKNSFDGLKSRKICAGSLMKFSSEKGGVQTRAESNTILTRSSAPKHSHVAGNGARRLRHFDVSRPPALAEFLIGKRNGMC